MPLIKSSSKKAVGENIKELEKANQGKSKPRPQKQIIAIALENRRRNMSK